MTRNIPGEAPSGLRIFAETAGFVFLFFFVGLPAILALGYAWLWWMDLSIKLLGGPAS